MEFDDESTITKDELKQKLADREAAVAAEKKRVEEYQASRNQGASGFGAAPAKNDSPTSAMDFKF